MSNSHGQEYDIAIIGAGFAGLGAGIRLKMKGDSSFVIFEKAEEIGGTWRDNTYPGCGCDIPSLLYSYSFEPNPKWSRAFSKQAEILEYMKSCAEKYQMYEHIQFNSKITKAQFNNETGRWTITEKNGQETTARVLISAVGPFNEAFIPKIKGINRFQGESFHSLHWNHKYDLTGKRVAVIGTGASAIQFIPKIAKQVKQLHIFQRTAPYIAPKPDHAYSDEAHRRWARWPKYQLLWREFIYWFLEYQGQSQYAKNRIRKRRTKVVLKHLAAQIPDLELRKKLTPDYELGCKRILISQDYYPTLMRDNIELINSGAAEILTNAVVSKSGEKIEVDAIIYGTGFYTTEFPNVYKLINGEGVNIFDKFNEEGPEGYLGVTATDYPNFAFIVGPNSGLGHNSIIHIMESQINYILDYVDLLKNQKNPKTYFNVKPEVQAKFNEDIQKELSKMVWASEGCESYYLKDRNGKNTSIWPGSTYKYRKKTKRVNLDDYHIIKP